MERKWVLGAWVLLIVTLAALLPVALAQREPPAAWDQVAAAVRKQLKEDRTLVGDRFRVSASGLVLTLSGTVDTDKERDHAIDVARQAADPAHMFVVADLRVTPPPDGGSDAARTLDQKLASEVSERVARLVPGSITVTVTGQKATVSGVVPSEEMRARVLGVARASVGVNEVVDRIEVRAVADAGNIH
jgi:osmotically-inducible protein OsmY